MRWRSTILTIIFSLGLAACDTAYREEIGNSPGSVMDLDCPGPGCPSGPGVMIEGPVPIQ